MYIYHVRLTDIADYRSKWAQLERSKNPFAWVVMAHLKAMETVGKTEERYRWKWELTQILYRKGYTEQEIEDLYWFRDWIMAMPAKEERRFDEELVAWEKEHKMRYVIGAERRAEARGRKDGLLEGRQETLLQLLQVKFREVPEEITQQVRGLNKQALEQMTERILTAQTLAEMGLGNGHSANGHTS